MAVRIFQDGNSTYPVRRVSITSQYNAPTSTTSTIWTATNLSILVNPITPTNIMQVTMIGQLAQGEATIIRDDSGTVHMFDATHGGARNDNSTLVTMIAMDVPGTTNQVRYRVYIRSLTGASCIWNNNFGGGFPHDMACNLIEYFA